MGNPWTEDFSCNNRSISLTYFSTKTDINADTGCSSKKYKLYFFKYYTRNKTIILICLVTVTVRVK